MKKLIEYLSSLVKTENEQEIRHLINEITASLKNVHFGMDEESEVVTKKDLLRDLDRYSQNPMDKTNLKIRIFFLTQLL